MEFVDVVFGYICHGGAKMNENVDLFDNIQEYKVVKMILQGIVDVYGLIGNRDKYKIDCVMTKQFDRLYSIYDDFEMLSVEGARDGIFVAEIQKHKCVNERKIVLDPVDGTLTCANGGSRSISAIAVADQVKNNYFKIPDSISCFSFGSNINPLYDAVFDNTNFENDYVKRIIKSSGKLSTLNRKESKELWNEYLNNEKDITIGEKTFFMPNELSNILFKAGDASITLFFETDSYIGRSGGTEALIESRLWKYWSGILVSGKKIKTFKDGACSYLRLRVKYSKGDYDEGAKIMFEQCELDELYAMGWTNEKIMRPLKVDDFSPNYNFIAIASITGTIDSKFKEHSRNNLKPICMDSDNNIMTVGFWMKNKNFTGFIDFHFYLCTGDFTWKKKNI